MSDLTGRGQSALNGEDLVFVLFAVGAFLLFLLRGLSQELNLFVDRVSITFIAVVIEAVGFVLLGSLIGGVIEEYVPSRLIARLNRKMPRLIIFLTAASGIIFPICECAIIPVTRRLVRKGVPLGAAVAFLLAVPIVNPVVWVTTFIAFGNSFTHAFIRFGSGYAIAVIVGFIFHGLYPAGKAALSRDLAVDHNGVEESGCRECGHDDHHHHTDTGQRASFSKKVRRIVQHSINDFFDVVKYLVLGAFIAACLRTVIGTSGIGGFSSAFLSIPSAMGTAFVLNLCSEADAFIGASFRGMLPFSAIMSFLILGPMLDIKLLSAYKLLFSRKAALSLALIIVITVGLWSTGMFFIQGAAGG
jgi:uncharacterized protein